MVAEVFLREKIQIESYIVHQKKKDHSSASSHRGN